MSKAEIVADLGKVILGIIMMIVSGVNLFKVSELSNSITSMLLLFGGIGTIMWGIQK